MMDLYFMMMIFQRYLHQKNNYKLKTDYTFTVNFHHSIFNYIDKKVYYCEFPLENHINFHILYKMLAVTEEILDHLQSKIP
jgi:hypothetical protein